MTHTKVRHGLYIQPTGSTLASALPCLDQLVCTEQFVSVCAQQIDSRIRELLIPETVRNLLLLLLFLLSRSMSSLTQILKLTPTKKSLILSNSPFPRNFSKSRQTFGEHRMRPRFKIAQNVVMVWIWLKVLACQNIGGGNNLFVMLRRMYKKMTRASSTGHYMMKNWDTQKITLKQQHTPTIHARLKLEELQVFWHLLVSFQKKTSRTQREMECTSSSDSCEGLWYRDDQWIVSCHLQSTLRARTQMQDIGTYRVVASIFFSFSVSTSNTVDQGKDRKW